MQNSVSKIAGLALVTISIALLSACAATTPSVSGGDDVVAKLSAVGIDCEVEEGPDERVSCVIDGFGVQYVDYYPSFDAMKAYHQEITRAGYCSEPNDPFARLLVGDNFEAAILWDEEDVTNEEVVERFQKALGGELMTNQDYVCEYLGVVTPDTAG